MGLDTNYEKPKHSAGRLCDLAHIEPGQSGPWCRPDLDVQTHRETKIMTENLSYPVCLFAVWAMTQMFERPSVRRQFVVVAFIVLAVAT